MAKACRNPFGHAFGSPLSKPQSCITALMIRHPWEREKVQSGAVLARERDLSPKTRSRASSSSVGTGTALWWLLPRFLSVAITMRLPARSIRCGVRASASEIRQPRWVSVKANIRCSRLGSLAAVARKCPRSSEVRYLRAPSGAKRSICSGIFNTFRRQVSHISIKTASEMALFPQRRPEVCNTIPHSVA